MKPKLDLGSGAFPAPGYIHLDKRKLDHVEIIWDVEDIPWAVRSESYSEIRMSHLIEHIKPWLTIQIIDECWRVLKKGGFLIISAPYATSHGMYSDPSHCNFVNETFGEYFDPAYPLYQVYKPKPWLSGEVKWDPQMNIEIRLKKMEENK